jgi:hypothetical protein
MARSYDVGEDRLAQHCGAENAYGGYEKVAHPGGWFSMEPTEDSK